MKKISLSVLQTEIKRQPKAFITEEDIKVINAKRYLTLKEAAIVLNISPLTLRRWTLGGQMNATKLGKKWMFEHLSIASTCKVSAHSMKQSVKVNVDRNVF